VAIGRGTPGRSAVEIVLDDRGEGDAEAVEVAQQLGHARLAGVGLLPVLHADRPDAGLLLHPTDDSDAKTDGWWGGSGGRGDSGQGRPAPTTVYPTPVPTTPARTPTVTPVTPLPTTTTRPPTTVPTSAMPPGCVTSPEPACPTGGGDPTLKPVDPGAPGPNVRPVETATTPPAGGGQKPPA
jgi:hypothetical protein